MPDLKIALVQSELLWENPAENRRYFEEIFSSIQNCDLVVLPEMCTTGFSMNTALAEPMDGDSVLWLKEQSIRHNFAIACSMMIRNDHNLAFNRFLCATTKQELHHYDKRHLFRMAGESNYYQAGNRRTVFSINGWKIMPQVCYDLRFPVWSRNNLGYDLILNVANWPKARVAAWEKLIAARAIENQCYMVGVNRTGTDGTGKEYNGSSRAVDFLGNTMVEAFDHPAVLRAELLRSPLMEYKKQFPAWMDMDSFAIDH